MKPPEKSSTNSEVGHPRHSQLVVRNNFSPTPVLDSRYGRRHFVIMQPKIFVLVQHCIETGVQVGWDTAHEHWEQPSDDQVQEAIIQAITDEFHEYFEFSDVE